MALGFAVSAAALGVFGYSTYFMNYDGKFFLFNTENA